MLDRATPILSSRGEPFDRMHLHLRVGTTLLLTGESDAAQAALSEYVQIAGTCSPLQADALLGLAAIAATAATRTPPLTSSAPPNYMTTASHQTQSLANWNVGSSCRRANGTASQPGTPPSVKARH